MEVFKLTLDQMIVLFIFMLIGFILRKKKIEPQNAQTVLSRAVAYVFMPAMNFRNLLKNATVESFAENSSLLLYGVSLLAVMLLLSYPYTKVLFARDEKTPENEYARNIYKYAFAMANFGYVGNVLILGVFGEAMLYKYQIFTLPLSIAVNSWGMYIMVPKHEGKGIGHLFKGLLNPLLISVVLGFTCGMLGVGKFLETSAPKVNEILLKLLDQASDCVGPVCMLLAGMVVGNYAMKSLFRNPKVYITTFLRLIGIPAVMMGVLKLLGTPDEVLSLALIAFATPIGLNVIVFPATYGSDTKPGAGMVLISNVLAVATIPLMYLLFVELL